MDFGRALDGMREGLKMRRSGWNGKGMWVALTNFHTLKNTGEVVTIDRTGMTLPFIYMKTADDELVPWLASQTDMLAYDWEVAT